MFSYTINWVNFVMAYTPFIKLKFWRLQWHEYLIVEIQKLHSLFLTYKTDSIYKVAHNGTKISMTKVLNDQFDSINQQIYIGLAIPEDQLFLFQKSEGQTNYIYRKYDPAIAYQVGQFANYGQYVWKCIAVSTGNTPVVGSAFWEIHKDRLYLYQKVEYTTPGFIVFVPDTLVYDAAQMNAWIIQYALAGMPYSIQTYTP
jgi:hypothetical protein